MRSTFLLFAAASLFTLTACQPLSIPQADAAGDPFSGLPAPSPNPSETPYRFETGPRVPKPDSAVDVPFPPAATPSAVKTPAPPPLAIVRTQPTGNAKGNEALVGAVTATFNQPMIPLAALEDVKAQDVPLVIEPKVPGRFRWLGTTTVTFEPEGRLPFATHYTFRVPAGVKSALGRTLAKEKSWSIDTPRPKAIAFYPAQGTTQATPETVIALSFNQRVDPEKVLAKISLVGPSGHVSLFPVPVGEWASLKGAGPTLASWDATRSAVFRPKTPLEKDSSYRVEIEPGFAGAEGPLPTTTRIGWGFRTYAPLRVKKISCGYDRCDPGVAWTVEFNNPLSGEPLEKKITVAPAVEDLAISSYGGGVAQLNGSFLAATTYTVTVSADVTDVYGQKLGSVVSKSHTTGDADPEANFPAQGTAISEAHGNRTVSLSLENVFDAHVRMSKIERKDVRFFAQLAALSPYFGNFDGRNKDPIRTPRKFAVDRALDLPKKRNVMSRVGLSLDDVLGKEKPGIVWVDLYSSDLAKKERYGSKWRALLVQVTDIGLAVKYDPEKIVVLATSIDDGKPMPGVDVTIEESNGKVWFKGVTGADGMVSTAGPRERPPKTVPLMLFAAKGDDLAFLLLSGSTSHGYVEGYSYTPAYLDKLVRSYVFTDRGIYRPEETVHLKGIVREKVNHPGGGIVALPSRANNITWSVRTPRGDEMTKGVAEIGAFGTFTVDLPIPRGADLGSYYFYGTVAGDLPGGGVSGSFQVQEYRAPEYKVEVDTGKGPWLFGQMLEGKVHGAYYFGAPLADAEVHWTLSRAQGFYAPPGNDGFSFGNHRWGYGWSLYGEADFDESPRRGGWNYRRAPASPFAAEGSGRLDAHGELAVKTLLERAKDDETTGPGSFTLEAQVFDKNRQAIAGRSSFVVHPASLYVGLRTTKTVIREKERIPLEAIAAAIDGTRIESDVAISVVEESWKQTAEKQADGSWKTRYAMKETEVGHCAIRTAKEAKSCDLVAPRAGHFLLKGTAKDAAAREATTTIDLWVYGEGQVTWRLNDAATLELVPDKTSYQVGDVAKVLVKSPFPRGEGILTFEAEGMLESKRVSFEGSAQVIEVPIAAKHLPNVVVGLTLARGRLKPDELPEGARAAEDLGRPAFAAGEVSLAVSLAPKTIKVTATPSKKEAGPGETIDLAISLSDDGGKPISGEAAVFLVDEGVLSLLGTQTPDPLATFYPVRGGGTALSDNREILLKQEKELRRARANYREEAEADEVTTTSLKGDARGGRNKYAEPPAPPGFAAQAEKKAVTRASAGADKMEFDGLDTGGEAGGQPMTARTEFASTAFWAGSVKTGADGKASMAVKLPDNLTTFRIMVVAVDPGDRFGHTDGQLTVRKPLLVRPSLPRFLNYGDSFEASMVVHNETGKAGTVELIARGVNVAFDEPARKQVTLEASGSAEVRWKAHALAAGTARVQFGASFAGASDAAEISFPVKMPATGEAFATYGTTEGSISQPVLLPTDVIPEYGALDVSTSSTALTTLGDAIDYLYDYPYECLEQTASRILPIFALKDVIKDFHLGDKDASAKADRLSKDGIARIVSLQGYDGGFRMWPESMREDPWASGYATFVLLRAKEAGYAVPPGVLDRAKAYQKNAGLNPPKEWGEYWRRAVQAQALLVLTEMGEKPEGVAQDLYNVRSELSFFSRAQLMVSLKRMAGANDGRVQELLRLVDNAAVETPSTAHYAEQRTESLKLLMHSEARTDAIVLWTMLEVRPDDPLIPKVVKGLNDSRVKGRWRTTQENAWVILAMSRYYKAYEKKVPEFVARAWMEDRFMGETKFAGRSMEMKQIHVPLETLLASNDARKPQNLVIAKDGPGRLYYRLGLTYAPKSLELKAEEQGFSVSRTYEPVEDKGDVVKQPDGTWSMKAGSTVRVRLTIVVPDRAYYAAIVDPLPAGLEAVNTALATTAQSRRSGEEDAVSNTWSWYSFWAFNHVQMRDDRVEVFADQLPAGVYEYTYLARATTFGSFVVPPLKAEEMYAPEVFGRTATAHVVVK